MTISLCIHGAAGTVTGSCHRLITPRGELLIDCGMFQGPKSLRVLNYRPFPFNAAGIAAVLLTHAHIDHTGLFPKLALAGFRGRAWTTDATRDLLHWLLPDAGAIQENDVERLNRRNARRAETGGDRDLHQGRCRGVPGCSSRRSLTSTGSNPCPGVRARLRNAGHILGSAFVELEVDAAPRPMRFVFSGDIGPLDKALQPDPTPPESADIALIELTYGDTVRKHLTEAGRRELLGRELTDASEGRRQRRRAGLRRGTDPGDPRRHRDAQAGGTPRRRTGVPGFPARRPNHRGVPPLSLARSTTSEDGRAFSGGDFRLSETVEQSKAIGRIHGGAVDPGRIRHVRRRPGQASPQGPSLAAELDGPLRRLPGARHAGRPDPRRRGARPHPRRRSARQGAHPRHRCLFRPRRPRRARWLGASDAGCARHGPAGPRRAERERQARRSVARSGSVARPHCHPLARPALRSCVPRRALGRQRRSSGEPRLGATWPALRATGTTTMPRPCSTCARR